MYQVPVYLMALLLYISTSDLYFNKVKANCISISVSWNKSQNVCSAGLTENDEAKVLQNFLRLQRHLSLHNN